MKNYFDEIKEKLRNNLKIEKIEIVDNSHKHKGHKFFSPEKYHLKLKNKIPSPKFNFKNKRSKNDNESFTRRVKN